MTLTTAGADPTDVQKDLSHSGLMITLETIFVRLATTWVKTSDRLGVRSCTAARPDLGRAQRGGAHGADLELLLRVGAQLHVVDGATQRGYALVRDEPTIVAATDVPTAQALLWTALAESPDDQIGVRVPRADQQWAIDVAHRAGLNLEPTGALCRRGDTGVLAPYLRHTALLQRPDDGPCTPCRRLDDLAMLVGDALFSAVPVV